MDNNELLTYFIDSTNKNLEEIKSNIKELKAKVDQIYQFKWQIVGGASVVSFIVTILMQVFFGKGV